MISNVSNCVKEKKKKKIAEIRQKRILKGVLQIVFSFLQLQA